MGAGVGAGVGRGVGAAVGQSAVWAWLPRQSWAELRDRYFLPYSCDVPSVLDWELGVFCVVLHAVHAFHPFQHPGSSQPGSQPSDSLHAPLGLMWPATSPEHALSRPR